MSDADKDAWKAFIAKLELEIAKLKADLARYETSSMELRNSADAPPAAAAPADASARFRQAIANMESVIETNRHRSE